MRAVCEMVQECEQGMDVVVIHFLLVLDFGADRIEDTKCYENPTVICHQELCAFHKFYPRLINISLDWRQWIHSERFAEASRAIRAEYRLLNHACCFQCAHYLTATFLMMSVIAKSAL